MTLLSCSKSLRISRDVIETQSFVTTCKIMTSSFFYKIGITWWLISAKVAPLKSCTFTKQFVLSLFSSISVIIESPTIMQVAAGHVCLISSGQGSFIVQFLSDRNFTSCCFLKKIELLTLFLSVVSYLFVSLVELMRMLGQSSFSLNICCIEQSLAGGSIFSL